MYGSYLLTTCDETVMKLIKLVPQADGSLLKLVSHWVVFALGVGGFL